MFIAKPLVKAHASFCGVYRKIRRCIAESNCHGGLLHKTSKDAQSERIGNLPRVKGSVQVGLIRKQPTLGGITHGSIASHQDRFECGFTPPNHCWQNEPSELTCSALVINAVYAWMIFGEGRPARMGWCWPQRARCHHHSLAGCPSRRRKRSGHHCPSHSHSMHPNHRLGRWQSSPGRHNRR